MTKGDDLTADHLEWLIQARYRNQHSSAVLYRLLINRSDEIEEMGQHDLARDLIAISFSLWRAAFLADHTGTKSRMLDDAKLFLGKLITDNAINYPQDRASREWTFSFYMRAAEVALAPMAEKWPDVSERVSTKKTYSKYPDAKHLWNRFQSALELAIFRLAEQLDYVGEAKAYIAESSN